MAIKSLDQRLDSILPDMPVEPAEPALNPIEYPEQETAGDVMEPVQVAGLADVLVGGVKVIKKGLTPTEKLADEASDAAIASQKALQQNAIEAEKTAIPGAVQAIKKAVTPKKAKPAQPEQLPPATTQEMQTAIKATEDAAAPAAPIEVVEPPFIIRAVDDDKAVKFLSGADAPSTTVDFNFNYIQGPEDIDKVINTTSEIFAKEMTSAKRGVLADEAVNDMASRINIAPDLLRARAGQTFNAEQLVAARHLLVRSATKLQEISTKVKEMPAGVEDDRLLLEFRNQLATHAAIQMRLKAAQTETARALRSFRLPVDGSTGLSDPQQIAGLLQEMGGRGNLKDLAVAYGKLTTDQQARFVDLAGTTSQQLGKVWREMYVSSLMYSPATVERAFFGNMILSLARSADTAFAGTVGKAVDQIFVTPVVGSRSSDEVYAAEAVVELANFFYSIPNGLKAGLKAFADEAPVYNMGRDLDKVPDPALSAKLFADPNTPTAHAVDFLGKAVRLPFRAMLAIDEMSKAQIAQMEVRRLAARDALLAIQNGMDSEKAMDAMAMQITNPDPRIIERVNQAVLDGTLQSELGSFGNALQKLRNDLNFDYAPIGTVLAPFIKTVINAQKQMLARTPVMNLALKEVRDDLAAGGARRQMALGKMSQGAAFMGMGYYLALDGTITGAGPTDPARRQFMRETTGWQPFSIKIGDSYRSYAGLEPIGGMLGVAATLAEVGAVYGREDDDEWHDLLLYSSLLPFKYIGELPFMQGMSNFVEMVEQVKRDPKGEAANTAAVKFFGGISQNFPGGVVPIPTPAGAMIRQLENYFDPTKREVTPDPSLPSEYRYLDFAMRNWLSKTPVFSEQISPYRNLWGKEVQTGDNSAIYWIVPFNKAAGDLDPIEETLLNIAKARQKMPINKPDRVISNIKLNDNEYSDMLLLMNMVTETANFSGKTLKAAVASVLTDPELVTQMSRGAYEGVSERLSKTVSEYKEAAVDHPVFAQKHPDAYRQIQKNRALALQQYQRVPREPLDIEE